jgi:hypothetical protein
MLFRILLKCLFASRCTEVICFSFVDVSPVFIYILTIDIQKWRRDIMAINEEIIKMIEEFFFSRNLAK